MTHKTPEQKIDAGTSMAEMWDGFTGIMIPDVPTGSIQYLEMKKAFYSGALALFNWFMVQLDEGTEPTDTDMARVERINTEIHSFFTTGQRQ